MFDTILIAQILGLFGIIINLSSLQFNKHYQILILRTTGTVFFVIQYLLLKAYVGMVMDLVGILRNVIFTVLVAKKKSTKLAIYLFSILVVISGLITIILSWGDTTVQLSKIWNINFTLATVFTVLLSVLSIIAKLISTISFGINNPHVIRLLNIPAASCWLLYNLINFSLTGAVNECFSIGSSIVGEIRFKKPKENKQESK